jgi:hypothetical protein
LTLLRPDRRMRPDRLWLFKDLVWSPNLVVLVFCPRRISFNA